MSRYVLDHHLEGEKKGLALMSSLLDPLHRRHIESLGISREARVLEVGCGNGSMSAWMAEHIAPDRQEFSPYLSIVPFTVTKTHRQILLPRLVMLQFPGSTLPTSDYKAGVTIPGISGNR